MSLQYLKGVNFILLVKFIVGHVSFLMFHGLMSAFCLSHLQANGHMHKIDSFLIF